MITMPPVLVAMVRRHPAFLLTVAYLAVSTVGLFFSWAFFRRFDVNYFLFADLTDFLLAAVREPMSVIAGIGAYLMIVLMYRYGNWELGVLEKRERRGRVLETYLRWNRRLLNGGWLLIGMIVLYTYVFVSLYAGWRADDVRAGEGKTVEVRIDGADAVALQLMGSSARFVFLYDAATQRTVIVPDESITALSIAAPERTAPDDD